MMPSGGLGAPLAPGLLLEDRFRLERLHESTAHGRRYLAADLRLGGQVAVEELFTAHLAEHEDRRRAGRWFEAQLRRLASLDHPGLARLRAGWTVPGGPFFLATEWTSGPTLAAELEDAGGAISWRRALDWGIALCDVLEYLHTRQPPYVHGLLAPGSVAIDAGSDRPLLRDLGLGALLHGGAPEQPGYQAFEAFIGRPEPRSDLYALGALLRMLLTGHDPGLELAHRRREGLDVQRAMRTLFAPLDSRIYGFPEALAGVLARATAFGASERFPDAGALGAALRAVRGPEVEVRTPADAQEQAPAWTRLGLDRRAWFALPATERNARLLSLLRDPR